LSLRDAKSALQAAEEDINKIKDGKGGSMAEAMFDLQRAAEKTFKALLSELGISYQLGHGGRGDRIIDEKRFAEAWGKLEKRLSDRRGLFDVAKWHLVRAWVDSTLLPSAREAAEYAFPSLLSAAEAWNHSLNIPVAEKLLEQFQGTHRSVSTTIVWLREHRLVDR